MNILILSIMTSLIISACSEQSGANQDPEGRTTMSIQNVDSLIPSELYNLSDVEKIMGETMHLTDSSISHKEGVLRYLYGYKANSNDIKSGRTGSIYFLFEQFDRVASAHDKYISTKSANEHNGIQTLDGLGDEAYFHSDGEHFYFIMVRKGETVFNMKVNKITSTTSLEEFKRVANKIAMNI